MTWIQTYTGKKFSFEDIEKLDTSVIDIEDISHSLSLQCRFNGHCKQFYSIAQHSVLVHDLFCYTLKKCLNGFSSTKKLLKYVLLHDAHEAYTGDITKPFKYILNIHSREKVSIIEEHIDNLIFSNFGILDLANDSYCISCKSLMDYLSLFIEQRDLMNDCEHEWENKFDNIKSNSDEIYGEYYDKELKYLFFDNIKDIANVDIFSSIEPMSPVLSHAHFMIVFERIEGLNSIDKLNRHIEHHGSRIIKK